MTSLRVRGADVDFDRSGEGPNFIWGHGLSQSRAIEDARGLIDWSTVPASVVRYDARGHGRTTTTNDLADYTWEALAQDQLAIADQLGIDRYIAGGASMGCATALHAAVAAPQRVGALILVIPPTAWETRAAQVATYEQGAKAIEAYGVEAVITASAAMPPPDPFVGDPDFRRLQGDAMRSWEPERLVHVMRGAAGADLPDRDAIAAIECPALILAWTGDAGHPTTTADELQALIPGSRMHVASTAADLAGWSDLVSSFVADVAAGTP